MIDEEIEKVRKLAACRIGWKDAVFVKRLSGYPPAAVLSSGERQKLSRLYFKYRRQSGWEAALVPTSVSTYKHKKAHKAAEKGDSPAPGGTP